MNASSLFTTERDRAMAATTSLMTVEDLLALPDDGIDRELIRGELREYPMTTRGAPHCLAMTNLAVLLGVWLRQQPQPRGRLYTGDIRVLLRRDPDIFVGIDLAYISAELAEQTAADATYINGVPVLAVEIISPTDTAEGMAEKVRAYLDAGVSTVWEVNPYYEVVVVHRPGELTVSFNSAQELTGEPHLPGLRIPVAEIFAP
jgi:Uma2 family endonuclease